MLLRNSISSTKKFFRKTLQSFKSLFSGDYQRLPKTPPHKQESEVEVYSGSFMELSPKKKKKNLVERREPEYHNHGDQRKIREDYSCSKRRTRGGKTNWLVVQKLRELEMLDMSNVDHLLDIEEVLHYYSRLTCPAYLDIVDKFFMDMCAEFFGAAGTLTPARSISSRLEKHNKYN
ncbi:uncharacterized protein LOC132166655 [Corylus avellana]|uniref:uncharacterized protein LOC132166655 n=1 Tax=Corylus avellana TaxID=13451 RepID=UPI001E23C1C5|nr:uncharacterized protein LOC132166655 [Corylus avellana]